MKPEIDLNPLNQKYAEIQMRLAKREQSERQLVDELHWYNHLDPQALEHDQRVTEARAAQLRQDIQALDRDVQECRARLAEIEPAIGTLFNPLNWFAMDQIELRRRRDELRARCNQKAAQKQAKDAELDSTLARIASVANELGRYRAFDAPRRQEELAQLRQKIRDAQDELAIVGERKQRVDATLAPLLQEMQRLERSKRDAEQDLKAAEDLDRRLSLASNPRDRALIHEQCERQFGEGSPRKVIVERQRKIRQLEHDYDKARRRAEDVARKAALRIDMIVIDGNNLCYEGDRFIGLAAIEAIIPKLARMYQVVIVFDAAIRRRLNVNDADLRKRLGNDAQVHVVASREKADETILNLASANEFAYVLSNDRFGDFNDKPAVKAGRIIRHEIVNRHIFINDLQLQAAYRQGA